MNAYFECNISLTVNVIFANRHHDDCNFPYLVEVGSKKSGNPHLDGREASGTPGDTGNLFSS